jgi:hypothetical protein
MPHSPDDVLDHAPACGALQGRDFQDQDTGRPCTAPTGLEEIEELRMGDQLTGRHDPVVR